MGAPKNRNGTPPKGQYGVTSYWGRREGIAVEATEKLGTRECSGGAGTRTPEWTHTPLPGTSVHTQNQQCGSDSG